ncbi:hypothetical protein B0J18DRAFT_427464 [Chaetomium sp. MPI-SDFR-AT-0129]|nr:hypothetical protein B0J18DRAFT_427464 [Chaetomium sp. MPI-SDFR-AT-0129]
MRSQTGLDVNSSAISPAAGPVGHERSATSHDGRGLLPAAEVLSCIASTNDCASYGLTKRGSQDTRIHKGTEYTRRAAGPSNGMLVDSGALVHIDQNDYIEFRVLYEID